MRRLQAARIGVKTYFAKSLRQVLGGPCLLGLRQPRYNNVPRSTTMATVK
jgi:hypothetical protein